MAAAKKTTTKKAAAKKSTVKKKADKVFDVTSPGESTPSASARPIIVSDRSTVKDPMVTTAPPLVDSEVKDGAPEDSATTEPLVRKRPRRIEPLGNEQAEITPVEPVASSTKEDSVAEPEEPIDTTAAEETTVPAEAEEPAAPVKTAQPQPTAAETAANDALEDSVADAAIADQKKADTNAAKQATTDTEALVASRQYFLPINAVKKRRSRAALVVLVLILIGLLGALAVLDAGLIDIGLAPPTNFIAD